MAGGNIPIFEETKVSSDTTEMIIDRISNMMHQQPLYCSLVIGIFFLVIFIQIFNIQ